MTQNNDGESLKKQAKTFKEIQEWIYELPLECRDYDKPIHQERLYVKWKTRAKGLGGRLSAIRKFAKKFHEFAIDCFLWKKAPEKWKVAGSGIDTFEYYDAKSVEKHLHELKAKAEELAVLLKEDLVGKELETEKVLKHLEDNFFKLAEDMHDFLIKELKLEGSGYAKLVSPIIWKWYKQEIKSKLVGEEAILLKEGE